MVEATQSLKPFTTVTYTTKDGEHISATKENGIVTLVGDKNGTRQMPIDDFMKEMIANLPVLEKSPAADTVEIKNPVAEKVAAEEKKAEVKPQTAQAAQPAQAPEVGKKLDVAA
ncbi:MAG: hypothetical protein NC191_02045 [Muribaculaceae bacterium]|nr:hypothetical protein [Muribaculaceae bacterium]